MERIYEDYKDLHVKAVKVYKKSGDSYAYLDSATTVQISQADLVDLFVKGVVVVDGDNLYHPIKLNTTSGIATITYVTADAETATVAVLETLRSE